MPRGKKRTLEGKTATRNEAADDDDHDGKSASRTSIARKSGEVKPERVSYAPPEKKVKSVLLKGRAPVDPECTSKVRVAHVYSEADDVYDAMLNQTNLENNNNKYYICQLLEDDDAKIYSVWFRWGRVGKAGQNSLTPCGSDLMKAKQLFMQKFYDKTKNQWTQRYCFVKVPGKYDLLQMDYGSLNSEDSADQDESKLKSEIPESRLDPRVQSLIELICDVRAMEASVKEMKYDSKKAPLGKLTTTQIKAGYTALKAIDDCIQMRSFGLDHVQACNDFYTRIPHDFGMQRPPLIRTNEEVRLKLQLLEALGDIQIAMTMIKEDAKSSENPVDRRYKSLDIDLEPVDKLSSEFEMINDYLQTTHAKTHSHYKMVLNEVFSCNKNTDEKNFRDYGNRMLLWHGSRLTNWVGILKNGLRIAPPEAPVTGYMFGKGVYFADMSSKSANYCFATKSKNVGLLLLCDVSLGTWNELLAADYNANKLPPGFHSVKGLGSVAPDPTGMEHICGGAVHVPKGRPIDTGVKNPNGYTLNYNEYIVYDTFQIRMKYLCKVEMKF